MRPPLGRLRLGLAPVQPTGPGTAEPSVRAAVPTAAGTAPPVCASAANNFTTLDGSSSLWVI